MSNPNPRPEVWLRGPLDGIAPELQPAAHALLQASEEISRIASSLTPEQVWTRPGGAASIGFHLRHIPGIIDRLGSYARGASLDDAQRAALAVEGVSGTPPEGGAELVARARLAIDGVVDSFRRIDRGTLFEPRGVGRAHLPSTVFGILSHIAEHTQRHVGQIVATAQVVRANTAS